MHTEKQRIFNEYAQSHGYDDWNDLIKLYNERVVIELIPTPDIELDEHIFAACDLVQQEQQKRIADNVMMKNHDGTSKKNRHLTYFQNGSDNIQIDKDTITNPENLIK